ncbi:MAG: metal ABC transporter substrate-binding protein [Kiritimatiellia bacterium]
MKYSKLIVIHALWAILCASGVWGATAELSVASLNPILTDLARQIGGERITVIELMRADENPHAYTPTPRQLQAAQQAQLILASGKGLESYLQDIRDNLSAGQRLLDVGATIPSLIAEHSDCGHDHHHHNAVDPHWWHSIKNIKRAMRIIATALAELAPQNSEYFNTRRSEYNRTLDQLERWARKELAQIPRSERVLTTAHNSFGYFCRDFGFETAPILGLSSETTPEPRQITEVVKTVKLKNIKAVFPEKNVNPKTVETIARETGIRLGGYLLAGSPEKEHPTYEAMFRHNVSTIAKALAPMETHAH